MIFKLLKRKRKCRFEFMSSENVKTPVYMYGLKIGDADMEHITKLCRKHTYAFKMPVDSWKLADYKGSNCDDLIAICDKRGEE